MTEQLTVIAHLRALDGQIEGTKARQSSRL